MKPRVLIPALLAALLLTPPIQAQTKDLAALVEGNSQFALDLYKQISKEPGNTFFSPYSISTALGMTYAGAKGKTAQEMAQALHFTLDNERLHPAFGELIRSIQGNEKKRDFLLTTANSLWGNNADLNLSPNFLHIVQTDYQSDFQLVDYVNDAEGSRRKINGWVEEKTNNKIKELIPSAAINRLTRLILVNAIYFKGTWLETFSKDRTKLDEFAVSGTTAVKVPMMHNTLFIKQMGNEDFQLAELPYLDREVSMVIVLPKKKDGLPAVEMKLTPKLLQEAMSQAKSTHTKLSLPKFKMTTEFELNQKLNVLGMKEAFMEKIADFTGMESKVRRQDSLYITKVVHKAFVDVHEEGTEAAAATGVVMGRATSAPPPPQPFVADHPFIFLVRHNTSGSILFMGRVDDPRGK